MKVVRFSSAENYEPEKDWKRVSLCNEKDISIEHFVKPPHHASPLHDHPNAQVLVVLKGKLAIVTDGSGEQVLGWAALTSVSDRCVYGGVAEVSVYVTESVWGRGIGRALLQALVEASEQAGLWTLQAGIFPENEVSIALHEKCGFRIVGRRERLGQMNGVWRDVVLMERRSKTVGI